MTALLITIITAAVWYAFWNLGKGLEARGYVRGYRKAVQDRAKDILKAKLDGAEDEREPDQIRQERAEQPKRETVMGCKHCGLSFAYGSKCPHPDSFEGFHEGHMFYADTGEPVEDQDKAWSSGPEMPYAPQPSEHDTANGLITALDGLQRSIAENCDPSQP